MRKCGTCKHWNFKVSTEKCWGQCLNKKARSGFYISAHIPERNMKYTEILDFKNDVKMNCDVYFEENMWGCIHHQAHNKPLDADRVKAGSGS